LLARFWPPASVSLGPCNFRRRVKARVFPWFVPLPISVLAHARSPVRCPTPRFVFHRAPGLGLHRFSCAQGSPLVSLVPHLSGLLLSDLVLPFPISAAERRPAPGPRAPVCSSSLVRARRPDFGASDFRFRVLAVRRQASPFSARFRCALRKAEAKDFFISAQVRCLSLVSSCRSWFPPRTDFAARSRAPGPLSTRC
jgi:hypothetical protein